MQQQIQEAIRPLMEQRDITSAVIRGQQIKEEFQRAAKPMRFQRRRW
jgi:hypothetical protein